MRKRIVIQKRRVKVWYLYSSFVVVFIRITTVPVVSHYTKIWYKSYNSYFYLKQDVPEKDEDENQTKSEGAPGENDEQSTEPSNKPIASHLIAGTAWCVVWTGDDKVFFFNPTTKVSIWERPEELIDNKNVDEILEAGPAKKGQSKFVL